MSIVRPIFCALLLVVAGLPGRPAAAEELRPVLTHVAPDKDRDNGRGRKLVVIYYGNDIDLPRRNNPVYLNLDAFREKIEQVEKGDALADDAKTRLAEIARLVDQRYSDIIDDSAREIGWLELAAQRKNFVLATIRNFGNRTEVNNHEPRERLFREIEWRHGPYVTLNADSVSTTFRLEKIRLPYELGDARFSFAPLSQPAVFREVIQSITARFPGDEYCFVLIVRSPATRESMLTDILTADIKTLDALPLANVVLQAIEGTDLSKLTSEQAADRVNQAIVDKFLTPELVRLRAAMESDLKESGGILKNRPDYMARVMQAHEFGTSKGEFFYSLNAFGLGRDAAFFPLVVLAGPRSRLETSSDPELKEVLAQSPGNYEAFHMNHINRVFAQGDTPVNITEALQKATEDNSPDFAGSLHRHLLPSNE